jgi:hypothetical protein
MNSVARQAMFDQAAAHFRDEQHRLAKLSSEIRKRNWHLCPRNVHVLALYLYDTAPEEHKRSAIGWAICDTKKYRPEIVVAKCLELDGKYRPR